MLIGMAVVFTFLSILVIVVSGLARWFPAEPLASADVSASTDNADEIAAATAAVHHYRQRHRNTEKSSSQGQHSTSSQP